MMYYEKRRVIGVPDPSTVLLQAACIIVLVAISAFFSASETAISTVNILRLKNITGKDKKKAAAVIELAENYGKTITSILVGNNIVNIASATLGTLLFTSLFKGYGAVVSTIVVTIIVLVFGEILPKNYAKAAPERYAIRFIKPLNFIIRVLWPITWFFNKLRGAMVKNEEDGQPSVTEEELKQIIDEIEEEGIIEKEESELVQSALDFHDIIVSKILTPRVDIIALDKEDGIEGLSEIFRTENFSRIPVYEGTVDNIVGIVHCQDYLTKITSKVDFTLEDIIVKPMFVPPSKKISALLQELQRSKNHMAIVPDQYGGTMGLVTLEDIIEELVGEIWDEHDVIEEDIIEVAENHYQVDGTTDINDLLENLNYAEHEDSITVGGYIIEYAGRIPECGESFEINGILFTVVETDDQRITKVAVKPIFKPEEIEEE